jgi:1-acyl-sn-glycerol-3-phosphate acyltransferase
MVLYIASMCVSLPLTLLPLKLAERLRLIGRLRREQLSLRVGCFCSRWMFRLIPFARLTAVPASASEGGDDPKGDPKPSVWVCNHTSMLDIFVMLAMDKRLRGTSKRPIKIVYWKGLEDNPVTKLLFTMCGMISVDMADNGNGNANEYDRSSFKSLLKNIKAAFEEGFDVGILPEGQLNPNPEGGLLPVFGGAFSLARMSRRPIRMMALHGVHRLWHPDEAVTMPTGRDVTVRTYPEGRPFGSGDEFVRVFTEVVGHFGAKGTDVPDLEGWLDGTKWDQEEQQVLSAEKHTEEKAEEEKK